ncbi:stereocilin-like [Huso huso]|uniref:Stereocilin-like n=1 Tax=Huso huso TaxID=61971 RepID=A0ABR0YWQ5_HUSHU
MAVLLPLLVVLLLKEPVHSSGDRSAKLVGVWKDVASLWRRGGVWDPRREQEPLAGPQGRRIQTVVSNIMDGLHTLGLLPRKSMSLPPPLSPPSSPLDRNRLSGFLYNISMYLQGSGGEPEAGAGPFPSDQAREQFWGNMLYSLLQPEGGAGLGPTEEKVPPRPSFRILELFLSLRGSQHWDGLLGLVQTVMSLFERQQLHPLLTFLRQNWDTISALLETALQALVSSTYGQASAGLQGFLCALSGRTDCGFNLDWLQQLFRFMEARNWKPVVSFLPGIGSSGGPQGDSPPFERFKPFSVLPGALKGDPLASSQSQPDSRGLGSVQTLLLQALSQSSEAERAEPVGEPDPALWQRLDGLQRGLLRRVGSSVYASLKRKVARVTVSLLGDVSALVGVPKADRDGKCSVGNVSFCLGRGIRNNITWNAQALGFTSQGLPSRPPFMSCSPAGQGRARRREAKRGAARRESRQHGGAVGRPKVLNPEEEGGEADFPFPTEILEAACNDSIPGLTGVSNFTVFLYCNLFDGGGSAREPEAGQAGLDLRATCSDAAWYLSAAEDDFLWVQVCSEFFTSEFNNTVCANSSFWQQRTHSQAAAVKDYYTYNQSNIDELCVQLSGNVSEHSGTEASEDCLTHLGVGALSIQNFRRCFLPNDSVLIWALCGNVTLLEEGSWAANFCSKSRQNSSHVNVIKETCDYRSWPPGSFGNATLLEQCQGAEGLREHICRNTTFYHLLVTSHPWLLGYCADPEANPEDDRCFLHRIFDMLPATYDFDSSQLCQNPAPYLLDALYQLSQCEGAVEERHGWIGSVNYVLRMVDFIVALSAGLEEGEREVRQVLGEAILLSSLLDNTSFWATFRPNASLSVLQTVGVFLKTEQNLTLKEDLLSCFSPVLWDLIQREHNSSALRVLFQEYLQMPQDNFRTLLMSAENDAVKRFLSHMHQTWDQLQVGNGCLVSQQDEQAMETMTSAFIHKFPRVTPDLFVDLSQFIPFMSVSDIMSFPASLLVNDSVLTAIRDHSPEMKSSQKRAFVKRLLQSHLFGEVPSWPPYFLSSILPLLPHLPLSHFQQLTAEQLSPLVEVLGNSSLDSTRGHHLMRTVFNKKRNLTADDVKRLGALLCSVNPEDLRPLLSARPLPSPLRERLLQCVSDGLTSATGRLSHWLLLALRPLNASVLTTPELASLHGILPQLGASFLQSLSTPRLLDILADPDLADFPPAQAFQLLTEIIQNTNLSVASLCRLRPLRSGLSPSVLRTFSPPSPWGSTCDCWRSLLSELSPAQRAAALDSLRVSRAVQLLPSDQPAKVCVQISAQQPPLMNGSQSWPPQMSCLVPYVPLKELALDRAAVLRNSALYRHLPWSTQQVLLYCYFSSLFVALLNVNWLLPFAGSVEFPPTEGARVEAVAVHNSLGFCFFSQAQFLLRKTLQSSNLTKETVMTLGNIAGGLGCDWLRLWANDSDFTELLRFLSDLPGGVRASLRKCIIEEIQKRPVIDLDQLAPQFSADLPVRMIESLSNATLASILEHITKHFPDFLRLPPHKQSILAEKAWLILVSGVPPEGGISGVSMDLLGPLLPFLDLGVLGVHREALLLCLDKVKGYCLPRDALPEIGQLLTERGMLGETSGWTLAQMEHAGRLLFTLSPQEIHRLPTVVVSPDSVEQVLDAQRRWKGSEVGRACMRMDREREKKESLVARIIHRGGKNKKDPIPSCADIKGTFPAAWSAAQLSGMLEPELRECVETLGQDRELSSEQRRAVWARFKQIYGPVKTMRAEQILQLGCIVTQLSERELQELDLSNLGILAYLGGMEEWSPKQMRVTVLRFLRGSGQTVEGLGVTELASLGFLLCGMSPSEMGRLDPRTLSAAALFLGELPVRCSELQSETLATRLMTTQAFGPVSEWGPEVFTEIGTLAAGLSDMVLSSLVREQLEGLTPAAIALIAPRKLAVVLSTAQLSWMTPEQAGAVTPAQWAELSSDQSQAVAMAQYEGELMQDPRGRSLAPTQPSPDSTAVWLLALGSVLCALV